MKRITTLLGACGLGLLAFTAPAGTPPDVAGVPVQGQMTITALNLSNHAILGQMTGDLTGGRRIRIVDSDIILLPTGFATLLKGRGSIITDDGRLFTRDRIVLKRVTPGEPLIDPTTTAVMTAARSARCAACRPGWPGRRPGPRRVAPAA